MPGTTENTGDSTSSVGSTSTASTPSTSTPSAPMTAVAALEKASGALSSSAAASGQPKPGDTAAANGTGTPVTTPAATQQGQTPGQPAATGNAPIPFDRHEAAVKNARTAGQTEALKAITGADTVTPQHHADVKTGYSLVGELRSNPRAFIENIAQDLGLQIVDPRTQQAPAASGIKPGQLPQADLVSEDGKKAYSAEVMLQILDAKVKEAVAQVQGSMQPLLSAHEQQQKDAEEAVIRAQNLEKSSNFLAQMRERPNFKEHEPAILAKLKAMDPAVKKSIGAYAALQTAYLDVLNEVVNPRLAADVEQKVRDQFTRKANTTGSIAPNSSQPTQPEKRPRNVSELSKHLEARLS